MSNCIAIAIGYGRDSEVKTSRLGRKAVATKANTHKTFIATHLNADGSGYVTIERVEVRDGSPTILAHLEFNSETSLRPEISASGLLGNAIANVTYDGPRSPDEGIGAPMTLK